MWELLGLDAKGQARGEVDALNSRRTGFDSWDLGDRLRSAVTGVTREQLERLSGSLADSELEEIYGPKATRARGNLGHLESNYQGIAGQTKTEIESQIAEDVQRGTALQQTLADNPRLDGTTIAPTANSGQIIQAGSKATIAHLDGKEKDAEDKDNRRYNDNQDLILMNMMNQQDDRRADRELRRDQQAYQNRALDLKEARSDRNDRRAAIQQLMAGLSTLGTSIAI